MPGGYVEYLKSYGIDVTVKKNSNINIGKFDGVLNFGYAKYAE